MQYLRQEQTFSFDQEQRLIHAIAPVTEHLQSLEHTGKDIMNTIEGVLQQGGIPFVLLRGESGSAKGQIQRELAALMFAEHPDIEMLTSSLAGAATELEKQGVVPAQWEEWTAEHFQMAEQAMVQRITDFYNAHKTSGQPVVMFNETILPLPGFPIGDQVIDLAKQMAMENGKIVPIIISPTTNDDIWHHTREVRTKIEHAKSSETLDNVLRKAHIKPVGIRRIRLKGLNPFEVYKESGNPAAMVRTRDFMNHALVGMAGILRELSTQPLPENILIDDLENPEIRQALLEAYQRKLIHDWDFPEETPIFIMKNEFLNQTIPWHDEIYRNFSGQSQKA